MCEGCSDLNELLYGDVSMRSTQDNGSRASNGHHLVRLLTSGEALLTLTIGALIANLLTQSPIFPLLLTGISLVLLRCLGLNVIGTLKRLVIPSYLTLVAILTQLFVTGQTPLAHLGPFIAYQEGLAHGILIGSKILCGVSVLIVFSVAVRGPQILASAQPTPLGYSWWQLLAARFHLPATLVEIAVLTYRYLFLLAEEAERVRQAQASRLGHRTWWSSVKSFGNLIGMIVVRSYDRAERVNDAMMLRGYTGNIVGTTDLAQSDISGFIAAAPLAIMLLLLGRVV